MDNLWNESELAKVKTIYTSNYPTALIEQIYASQLLGSDKNLVLHGGGNTSCKVKYKNIWGEEIDTLFIKASGCDMAQIKAEDFIALDLKHLLLLENKKDLSDEEMIKYFIMAKTLPSEALPSVETLLHAFLPFTFVTHTHPVVVLALINRLDSDKLVKEIFENSIELLPYVKVGIDCAVAVKKAIEKNPSCKGVLIKQHGLVTWGNSAKEAYLNTIKIVDEIKKFFIKNTIKHIEIGNREDKVGQANALYLKMAPIIRGALFYRNTYNEEINNAPVLYHLSDVKTLALLEKKEFRNHIVSSPVTPDYIIRIGREPLFFDIDNIDNVRESFEKKLNEYSQKHLNIIGKYFKDITILERYLPKVILIPQAGIICCGNSVEDAKRCADIIQLELEVKQKIFESGGEYYNLEEEHSVDMEFRIYQRAKIDKKEDRCVLNNRILLVTGAGGAIGRGICSYFLEKGCNVVASDIDKKSLDDFVLELKENSRTHKIFSLQMDVTDESSVKMGFETLVKLFGGVDAVVVNAGIAHVSTIEDMKLDDFWRLEKVNIDGTLLTIREAAKLFKRQGIGGDIVLISTKNVFSPGASFGAYSATKTASHQLARIASLELASINVRVNMVAPDAVFSYGNYKSGLWSTVGPDRMKSRGLDEKGLEEYYRNRNLLKAKVTANHVASAVEFFLRRSTPTTGSTIPVDGGLPDATPR